MQEALRKKLVDDADLMALVDSVAWDERPQGKLRSIVLQDVSPDRRYTFEGPQSLAIPHIQVDIWAPSVTAVWAIQRALIPIMESVATLDAWMIGPSFLDADRGMPPEDVGGTKLYRRTQDWFVTTGPPA